MLLQIEDDHVDDEGDEKTDMDPYARRAYIFYVVLLKNNSA